MNFDQLDERMRNFETSADQHVLPELFMVARIDGRSFTRLTKELHPFNRPFDEKVRDYMITTAEHLMQCGFHVVYAYTQSDEISLLFRQDEQLFNRKLRKYHSVLSGEASARFSLLLGDIACFDCRISQLPNETLVIDYFRWRNEDAARNALNAHCYWALRKTGLGASEADEQLRKLSVAEKNELLFQRGINFSQLPLWQRRGTGLYWETYEKTGENRRTGEPVTVTRRRIKTDMELPMKDDYTLFLRGLIAQATKGPASAA